MVVNIFEIVGMHVEYCSSIVQQVCEGLELVFSYEKLADGSHWNKHTRVGFKVSHAAQQGLAVLMAMVQVVLKW